ncbi:MAG: sigma-70 family RNA polymerase sigma factor [Deltaproteobacteria bacterium]|nr:sigma-70 family RNA polymerase sigma factor [Deltaproteobacteria bacterium]
MKEPIDVTGLLLDWSEGDREALVKLMPLVCDDLRRLAHHYLGKEARVQTFQPTSLVNEVYLRFHGYRKVSWKNRAQFFSVAGETMRRILIDHARGHHTSKRGKGVSPLPLDEAFGLANDRELDLVRLDDALKDLEKMDQRQARVVDLRFFVGLTVEETASALEISAPTVKRDWQFAKLWLRRELSRSGDREKVGDSSSQVIC